MRFSDEGFHIGDTGIHYFVSFIGGFDGRKGVSVWIFCDWTCEGVVGYVREAIRGFRGKGQFWILWGLDNTVIASVKRGEGVVNHHSAWQCVGIN